MRQFAYHWGEAMLSAGIACVCIGVLIITLFPPDDGHWPGREGEIIPPLPQPSSKTSRPIFEPEVLSSMKETAE